MIFIKKKNQTFKNDEKWHYSANCGGAVGKQQDTWSRDSGFEAHSRLENIENAENVEKMTGYSPWPYSMTDDL